MAFSKTVLASYRQQQWESVAIRQLSMPALLTASIANFQMHNIVKLIVSSEFCESGLADILSTNLFALLSNSVPLINLVTQIRTSTCVGQID